MTSSLAVLRHTFPEGVAEMILTYQQDLEVTEQVRARLRACLTQIQEVRTRKTSQNQQTAALFLKRVFHGKFTQRGAMCRKVFDYFVDHFFIFQSCTPKFQHMMREKLVHLYLYEGYVNASHYHYKLFGHDIPARPVCFCEDCILSTLFPNVRLPQIRALRVAYMYSNDATCCLEFCCRRLLDTGY